MLKSDALRAATQLAWLTLAWRAMVVTNSVGSLVSRSYVRRSSRRNARSTSSRSVRASPAAISSPISGLV